MSLTVVEIKELSKTKFAESVQVAELTLHEEPMLLLHREVEVATLSVPWGDGQGGENESGGVWKFLGPKLPIAGTLVVVEDLPDGSMRFIGATEDLYEVRINKN